MEIADQHGGHAFELLAVAADFRACNGSPG